MRVLTPVVLSLAAFCLAGCGGAPAGGPSNDKEDSSVTQSQAGGERRILFIHHSCGSNWMAGGLVAALEDPANPHTKGQYSFHDAQYGSYLGEGDSSLGRYTDLRDWYVKFSEDLDRPGDLVDMLNCDHQDETYGDGGENAVIMFKSCYPNSKILPADPSIDLDDPAVRAAWLDPDQGGYYNGMWGEGVGGPIDYVKAAYTGLLDIFREHPDRLFVAVTAPALHYQSTTPDDAQRARELNDWLRTEWLDGYRERGGRVNVAVFDWYREHAYSSDPDDANYWRNFLGKPGHEELTEENHAQLLNTLRLDYASPDGDSHPSKAANERLVKVFVEEFIGPTWEAWQGG
jgi:hypothetical protein